MARTSRCQLWSDDYSTIVLSVNGGKRDARHGLARPGGPEVEPGRPPEKPTPPAQGAASDRTKMLGARVPVSIHREFQLFRAQEQYPDLNMQVAIPAMICLLRGETVWRKFLAELKKG